MEGHDTSHHKCSAITHLWEESHGHAPMQVSSDPCKVSYSGTSTSPFSKIGLRDSLSFREIDQPKKENKSQVGSPEHRLVAWPLPNLQKVSCSRPKELHNGYTKSNRLSLAPQSKMEGKAKTGGTPSRATPAPNNSIHGSPCNKQNPWFSVPVDDGIFPFKRKKSCRKDFKIYLFWWSLPTSMVKGLPLATIIPELKQLWTL